MNHLMPATYQQFVALLRYAVCGGELLKDSYDWDALLRLARMHKMEALLWRTLKEVNGVPDVVRERLQVAWQRALMQDARQEYAAQLIGEVLTAHGIPFAPIKGLILKNDYPSRELRYMSDLDFYIRPDDRKRIHSAMTSLGAVVANTDSGDVNYEMPGRVLVEFHGMLLYRVGGVGVQSYADWNRVLPENQLTEEGYALNLIGHVIYNLAQAGCGARFVLDLWVYRHRHTKQPDWTIVKEQLKKDGLDLVAQNLFDLSEYWFGEGDGSPLLDELGSYILEGGLYGLSHRATLSVASNRGGKLGAVKAQLFRSRDEFENRYPWLKKYPYLLPVAWVMRGAKSLKIHRTAISHWVRRLNRDDPYEVLAQKARLERFGF